MAGFNLFDFSTVPGTPVQKIGTGVTMPQSSFQSTPQSIQKPQPAQNTMRFFKDEQEANEKMIQAGLSQEQANELHKKRRNDLLGKISREDGEALIKMRDAGLRADEAAKLVKQRRESAPDTRPLYKKAGEGALNFLAGNLDTVLKYGGNILDVATLGKAGFGEDVKGMTEQNKQLFGDSTAFKAGSYLPDVALSVAPLGKAVQGMSALKGGALVGAGFGAAQPLLEKGSEATIGDVATGGAVGGTVGAIAGPVISKGIEKGAKYGTALIKGGLEGAKKSISRDVSKLTVPGTTTVTRAIPKKIISNDLGFTPTERAKIERITGKDEATYVLEKGLAGKEKEELAGIFMKQADDMYNGITKKLAKVDKKVQSNTAKEALQDIIDQLESKPKFKRAYAKDIAGAKAMLERGNYTLSDLNNIRRAYDKVNTGMFTAQGAARSGIENEIDIKVRQELSDQLQKEAKLAGVDVKAMNNDLRAGLVMKDALLRRLSQEERNNFIGLQDLGVSAILSGGNPAVALGTVAAKKYAEKMAPSAAQKLYNLNKTPNVSRSVSRGNTISPRSKSSILNLTSDTVTPVASKQVKNPINIAEEKAKVSKPSILNMSQNKKGFISPKAISESAGLVKKFSPEGAIRTYTNDSGKINKMLREGKVNDQILALDKFLEQTKSYDGTVYRGLTLPESKIDAFIADVKKNGITDKAYMSSSRNYGDATTYSKTSKTNGTKGVMFEIESKNGKIIDPKYNAYNEEEIIFPRGTKFEYIGEYTDANRGNIIKLKESSK